MPRIRAHSNSRAAIPAVWAAARLVPDACSNSLPAPMEAVRIPTPGAAKSGFTILVCSYGHSVTGISWGSDREFRGGFQEIGLIGDQPPHRQPEVKPGVVRHSLLHQQFPDPRCRMQETEKHQRFSSSPFNWYVVDQDLRFHKYKRKLLSPIFQCRTDRKSFTCRRLDHNIVKIR